LKRKDFADKKRASADAVERSGWEATGGSADCVYRRPRAKRPSGPEKDQ